MFYKKQTFISNDRKVKLISDVDTLVPEKLKNQLAYIEEIIKKKKKNTFICLRQNRKKRRIN